jgi:sugar transferase (PEP-CTERM/EpsH1 system associated)
MSEIPLIVHLVYRLDMGGLETQMVERINRMPGERYRHAVVTLSGYNPGFAAKISKPGVDLYTLDKQAGLSLQTHARLWRLLRQLRPAVLHSYNLSAMEYAPAALLAGVPVRVNGAHGRDINDPHGTNRKHNALRRLLVPFYDACYANSAAMEVWNREVIRVPPRKSRVLTNGIDAERFRPRAADEARQFFDQEAIVIGTVGRLQAVKDHATLLDAFVLLRERRPQLRARLRLAIVGDGPLLVPLRERAAQAGLADLVWLPGARSDVPDLLRSMDVFAMSSLAEGTPGAALEAMACGLPVVGTRVGGIPEVIDNGVSGMLVEPGNAVAMADALEEYLASPALLRSHGVAARERVQRKYSMAAMVACYQELYDTLCERKIKIRRAIPSCAE